MCICIEMQIKDLILLKIKNFYICLKFKRKNGRLITFSHQTHRKLQIGHGNRNTVHCTNVLYKYCVTYAFKVLLQRATKLECWLL